MYKFSCVLPIYRGTKISDFKSSIDSVINQTISANEIIVHIDGPISLDLEHCVQDYNVNNKEITLIRNEVNLGLGLTLNKSIQMAKHLYIMRMDSDDVSMPQRFEILMKEISCRGDALVGSYITEIVGEKKYLRKVPLSYDGINRMVKLRNPFNHVSVCFNKEYISNAGGYLNCEYAEDWYLWLRLCRYTKKLSNIPISLVDVQVDDYQRRSGLKYFKHDLNNALKFHRESLISKLDVALIISTRLPVRILSPNLMRAFYTKILRTKAS